MTEDKAQYLKPDLPPRTPTGEIIDGCVDALRAGVDSVSLVLPAGQPQNFGAGRGELLCVNSGGNRVVSYRVEKLVSYLALMNRLKMARDFPRTKA